MNNNFGAAMKEWEMLVDYIIDDHHLSYPDINPDCTKEEFNNVFEGRLRNALGTIVAEYEVEQQHIDYFEADISRLVEDEADTNDGLEDGLVTGQRSKEE